MWLKIAILIIYLFIGMIVGRYVYIRRAYHIAQKGAYVLEEGIAQTNTEYGHEWFFSGIFWPVALLLYFLIKFIIWTCNVVDKIYIQSQKRKRTRNQN